MTATVETAAAAAEAVVPLPPPLLPQPVHAACRLQCGAKVDGVRRHGASRHHRLHQGELDKKQPATAVGAILVERLGDYNPALPHRYREDQGAGDALPPPRRCRRSVRPPPRLQLALPKGYPAHISATWQLGLCGAADVALPETATAGTSEAVGERVGRHNRRVGERAAQRTGCESTVPRSRPPDCLYRAAPTAGRPLHLGRTQRHGRLHQQAAKLADQEKLRNLGAAATLPNLLLLPLPKVWQLTETCVQRSAASDAQSAASAVFLSDASVLSPTWATTTRGRRRHSRGLCRNLRRRSHKLRRHRHHHLPHRHYHHHDNHHHPPPPPPPLPPPPPPARAESDSPRARDDNAFGSDSSASSDNVDGEDGASSCVLCVKGRDFFR